MRLVEKIDAAIRLSEFIYIAAKTDDYEAKLKDPAKTGDSGLVHFMGNLKEILNEIKKEIKDQEILSSSNSK